MALQQEIIQALGAKPAINANEEIRRSVDFLKAYLSAHPFLKTLVLGISGGQDSTLAGKLSQMAITELRDETGDTALQFIAVRLPYGVPATARGVNAGGNAGRESGGDDERHAVQYPQ